MSRLVGQNALSFMRNNTPFWSIEDILSFDGGAGAQFGSLDTELHVQRGTDTTALALAATSSFGVSLDVAAAIAAAPSVSIGDVTIAEGNSGTKVATFTVTRTGGAGAFNVSYATANGTATTADNDYVAKSGTLLFGNNVNSQTISIVIRGDTKIENNETFFINLSRATNGAVISDGQAIGTIATDDQSPGTIAINDVSISEGNSGTKVATFTVTRSGGSDAFAVNYATANGTATVSDGDYAAKSGTLSFGSSVNTQTVSVTINGDTKVEGNETFFLNLSGATNGAVIGDSQGSGTIVNDDTLSGNISINDVSITEGDSGTKVATFTVTRTGGNAAFTVNYATADSTATAADGDYAAKSGILSFGSNVNSQTVSITVNGDTRFEPNETFFVNLSNASNGVTITDGQGVGTIVNNDTAPVHAFDIQVSYAGDARFAATFDAAAARWEAAIVGDVPDISVAGIGLIDDLRIDAVVVTIDGVGGILGQAGPDGLRPGTLLPYHGNMQFDAADVEQMFNNGTLLGVITHEIGHILGFGTLWDLKGLKSDAFNYIGANALAEYRTLIGSSAPSSVPLENTGGGGTAGYHWSEAVFGAELMTGYANGSMPMSRMTIASLEDLGYAVDRSAADPYNLAPSLVGLKAADDYFGLV